MKKINEEFLHFLWKNQHLTGIALSASGKTVIRVVDPGIHNYDSGPDFFNAKVVIDGTTWAGNVELHINASDWIKHGHSSDQAYDSVILHVVCFNDCEIRRMNGEPIPVAMLRFPTLMWDTFNEMMNSGKWIPCRDHLRKNSRLHIVQWTSSLMVEKLMEKSLLIGKNMEGLHGHWDAVFTRLLFRSFGLPVNTIPFEMLSILLPYPLLLRNKSDLFSLESMLFGQAGMLSVTLPQDKYSEGLSQEYQRFSGNLEGTKVPAHIWKFMRMRPSSFPSLRIAQLAAFIHMRFPVHQLLEKLPAIEELYTLFRIRAGDYWNNHYQFGKESKSRMKYLGINFINTLIINCIAPYTFFYGKEQKIQKYCDYAIHLLEELPPEDNTIIRRWDVNGLKSNNAFESQALLYLYKNYCKGKRCLECQFGNSMILDRADNTHRRL
jgi:hypothetical protein